MVRSIFSSSGETKVQASPVALARPVRPTRWTYSSARGHVEVADQTKGLHVDAPGGDVRCHQDPEAPPLEAGQGLGPLTLAAVAVNPGAGHPVFFEEVGQPVGPVFGPGEGQDAPRLFCLRSASSRVDLSSCGTG